MLCYDENKRITMDEIIQHPWLRVYFRDEMNIEHKKQEPKISTSTSISSQLNTPSHSYIEHIEPMKNINIISPSYSNNTNIENDESIKEIKSAQIIRQSRTSQ